MGSAAPGFEASHSDQQRSTVVINQRGYAPNIPVRSLRSFAFRISVPLPTLRLVLDPHPPRPFST